MPLPLAARARLFNLVPHGDSLRQMDPLRSY